MRSLLILVVLVSFGEFSHQQEDCERNGRGFCIKTCPPGTFMYTPGCGPGRIAYTQPTCSSPTPTSMGEICDLSRCDCNPPKLLDEATQKCVDQCDCSPQSQATRPANDIWV